MAEVDRKIIQDGFLGGGRIECDGTRHVMVREDHEKLLCARETDLGPCLNREVCTAIAARLARARQA